MIDQKLKDYLLQNFDFAALKKAGFYRGIRKKDYQAQSERICKFFSLKSVYDYSDIGKDVAYHLSTVAALFECPVCTCPNEVEDVTPGRLMKCNGCKRKLRVYPTVNSFILVTEDKYKEKVETHY
jgi:hypothetical protein